MSTVHIVESAENRPHACAQCGGTKGPFLDTVVDVPEGRLYLCMLCLRIDAAEAGFAKGDRMDKLVHAKDTVEQAEHEIDARNSEIRKLRDTLASTNKSIAELQTLLEQAEGEIKRKDHLAQLAADNALAVIKPPEQAVVGLGIAG